jgi:Fic family protein
MVVLSLNLRVSPEILNRVSRVDHLRGLWTHGAGLPPDRLHRIREVVRIRSAAASCRMAGIRVSEEEVAKILAAGPLDLQERREVIAYAAAIDAPFPENGGPVTTLGLRGLHARLMAEPGDPPEPSAWRTEPFHLEAFDREGKALGRVFQTLPPRLVPEKMELLLDWLDTELGAQHQHPLLVIGAFMMALLAASPFRRGNGRVARLATVHLLVRAGYHHVPFASLERVLEELRQESWEAFDASETRLWTGEGDLTPWLEFFLEALVRHADRVGSKLDLERRALELSPLQRQIVETVRDHGTATPALLIAATGVNRNTLKDNLRRLVERGFLERIGQRRGTHYRIALGRS